MKKYFGFLVAIALSAGFISCSDNEKIVIKSRFFRMIFPQR